jgi:hypothetical protein
LLLDLTDLDGELGERLHDLAVPATRPRTAALHDEVLAHPGLGDDQLVDVQVVVVLGVGDRGLKAFLDVVAKCASSRR